MLAFWYNAALVALTVSFFVHHLFERWLDLVNEKANKQLELGVVSHALASRVITLEYCTGYSGLLVFMNGCFLFLSAIYLIRSTYVG